MDEKQTQELLALTKELKNSFDPEKQKKIEARIEEIGVELSSKNAEYLEKEKKNAEELEGLKKDLEMLNKNANFADFQKNNGNSIADCKKEINEYLCKNVIPQNSKYLRTDNTSSGGVLVVPEYYNTLLDKVTEDSPIRQISSVINIGSKSVRISAVKSRTSITAPGEGGTIQETQPGFRLVDLVTHSMDSYIPVSNELIEESEFDIEKMLFSLSVRDFAIQEGAWFLNGDAIEKPEGILKNADITSINTGDASNLTVDSIINITHSLKGAFAPTLVMNRQTFADVLKLKDGTGHYIFQPTMIEGLATIYGVPFVLAADMPDVAANASPIIIGDFKQGYWIADRKGLSLLRDVYTSSKNKITNMIFTKSVGGVVTQPDAFKKLIVKA